MSRAYACSCGWSGGSQERFVAHLAVGHDLRVKLPPAPKPVPNQGAQDGQG